MSVAAASPTGRVEREALPLVYWLTRDRRGGDLVDNVEIWAVRPQRLRCPDGDVIWLPPDEHLIGVHRGDACIGDWTVAEARVRVGPGIPETDIECTRVGEEPTPAELDVQ